MSASISNAQNPPIAASQTAAAANSPASGSSANVAAGPAPPTARSSYANATKKISSPPIASSAAPPVAVGGPQTAQHGKRASVSPVNGSNTIKPAVPTMGPTIVNSSGSNGAPPQGDHSRKPSVTISAQGTTGYIPNGGPVAGGRPASGLTFGSMADSPAASHVAPHHPQGQNLNPQMPNPRVASPAHSPSPIPTPNASGGKPDALPGRPGLVFGGGSDSADVNPPRNIPPQPASLPQAQHLRRESSQSAHSDISNPNINRAYPQGGGRGRGTPYNQYQQIHSSPTPYRPMPNQPRGPAGMPPAFQPQRNMQGSPFGQPRSPAITAAAMHQQQQAYMAGNPPPMYAGQYQQQNVYATPGMDAYAAYYGQNYPSQGYNMTQTGLAQSMYAPPVPPSPGRGQTYPHAPYPGMQPGYGPPQAPGMIRTPSNMSERPSSAIAQPSTPAMTNVNTSHHHTPSVSGSPAPSTTFAIPPKGKKVVIKAPDGTTVDFTKKPASPAPAAQPAQPKSPAIVATPTPPPRPESTHSRTESVATKTDKEKQADFVKQFHASLAADQQKGKDEKVAAEKAAAEAAAAEEKSKAEAEEKRKREEEEKLAAEKAAAEAKAAEEKAKADEEEKKRLEEEEFERMVAEMEAAEKAEAEREAAYAEKAKKEKEEKARRDAIEEEERLRKAEREAEEREAAKDVTETEEQKRERESLFAGLKKNTQFGPGANQTESPPPEPAAAANPPAPTPTTKVTGTKQKPAALKLETKAQIEPAQPTAGMQSLKSARFLAVQSDLVNYPEGIRSPNPALNAGRNKGRHTYDLAFLMQFKDIFSEKPSVDWDMRLKETVGDSSDSARPQSARPGSVGMGGRQSSRGAGGGVGPMGNFQGGFSSSGRTLPAGTTSEQRFNAASGRGSMTNPLAPFVPAAGRPGSGFPVQMARSSSFQNMGQQQPHSPRVGSSRGRGSRRGPDRPSANSAKDDKNMPLTSGVELKPIERTATGWTPHSLNRAAAAPPSGHLPPDMVQRKVKAALNKMTPEKFDKISDQILEIAGQSKDEQDGRTLRQVIQLTFEKACDEQHWSSMYAKFCSRMLNTMSTEIRDENVTNKAGEPIVGGALFRKYLLNRCQEEFEKGWEINLPEKPEGEGEAALLSDEYYVAAAAKRRGLGLIQFIGELYKLGMLTLRIMHECVLKLLDFEGAPDESAVESLSKLLVTIGGTMSQHETGPKMLAMYFDRIEKIMNMEGLPSRQKFMLMDLVDLRKNNWHDKKSSAKGPKTLAEIHQEAAAAQQAAEMERQRSNQRGGQRSHLGRGDARSFSGGGALPPQDFPTGRVQMDDLRKLSKGASGRNMGSSTLGPSMLGNRSNSGRRGLGPGGGLMARGDESGASSRTGTPPVQKEKEATTHVNSFSALMSLDNEGAGEVGSPPSTASSPPQGKAGLARSKSPAVESKPSE